MVELEVKTLSLSNEVVNGIPEIRDEEIGRGNFGVFKAKLNNQLIAVKKSNSISDTKWKHLCNEVHYHRFLLLLANNNSNRNISTQNHPNIVQFFGCYRPPNSKSIWLLMELMEGDLQSMLSSGKLPVLRDRIKLALDVAHGVKFLNTVNIIHRDLKCSNVLVSKEKVAKISDFGEAVDEMLHTNTTVGAPINMAPEILSGNYNFAVDIYSFGMNNPVVNS